MVNKKPQMQDVSGGEGYCGNAFQEQIDLPTSASQEHHGCLTAPGGNAGIVVAAMRPSAVAEMHKTVRIRIRRNFRPKLFKLAKMTECAYLADVTSRQSFCRSVFAQPRPIAYVEPQNLLHCDEVTSGTLASPATMPCPGPRARQRLIDLLR